MVVVSGVFKVFCQNRIQQRRISSEERISERVVEQIVDFPAQTVEQIVDTSVHRGRCQGFLPEQGSTATSSSGKRISERTVEQIVDIPSSGGGLGHESSSSAGPADEDFAGVFALFLMEKVRSAWQEVSAQLGRHVSSSTLGAHQMARAGEPVDFGGSDVWVLIRPPDISKSHYWNRRTNLTAWDPPAGVEVV